MNSITIAGNITKDAELRFTPGGDPVASFSVADNQGKDKDAIFWNCSMWGKRAETLAQYLQKGTPVTVTGRLTEEKWQDKQTGQDRKGFKLNVTDIALQGRAQGESEHAKQRQQAAPQQPQAPRPQQGNSFDDFIDDMPF